MTTQDPLAGLLLPPGGDAALRYTAEEATLGRLNNMPEFSDRTFSPSADARWE